VTARPVPGLQRRNVPGK